jgi:hypothetical protein
MRRRGWGWALMVLYWGNVIARWGDGCHGWLAGPRFHVEACLGESADLQGCMWTWTWSLPAIVCLLVYSRPDTPGSHSRLAVHIQKHL